MPHTDAEYRQALNECPSHRDRRLQLRRIARAIRQHHRVGPAIEDRLQITVVGQHIDLDSPGSQRAQGIAFDTVIDDYDAKPGPLPKAPTLPTRRGGG